MISGHTVGVYGACSFWAWLPSLLSLLLFLVLILVYENYKVCLTCFGEEKGLQ